MTINGTSWKRNWIVGHIGQVIGQLFMYHTTFLKKSRHRGQHCLINRRSQRQYQSHESSPRHVPKGYKAWFLSLGCKKPGSGSNTDEEKWKTEIYIRIEETDIVTQNAPLINTVFPAWATPAFGFTCCSYLHLLEICLTHCLTHPAESDADNRSKAGRPDSIHKMRQQNIYLLNSLKFRHNLCAK